MKMALRVGNVWGPAGSKKLNTGEWRTETPVVNYEKCVKCSICTRFCPEGCMEINDKLEIDMFYCKGCGLCAHECPAKAIEMSIPE